MRESRNRQEEYPDPLVIRPTPSRRAQSGRRINGRRGENYAEELRKYLPDYLLTAKDSIFCERLTKKILASLKMDESRPIRLTGDRFSGRHLLDLIQGWGRDVSVDQGGREPHEFIIEVPGPEEENRRQDIPLVISYMISLLWKKGEPPEYISGAVIAFLLFYPGWKDFQHIFEFLEKCMTCEAWKAGTITLWEAIKRTWNAFDGQINIPNELDTGLLEEIYMDQTERTMIDNRRKENAIIRAIHYGFRSEFDNPQVESYQFPLCSIKQVLKEALNLDHQGKALDLRKLLMSGKPKNFPEDDVPSKWEKAKKAMVIEALQFKEDGSIIIHGHKSYSLPRHHYLAAHYIASCHKNGFPWIKKGRVFEHSGRPDWERLSDLMSVRKWFTSNGGDAQRFAEDGLIETGEYATCRIPIHPKRILLAELLQGK